MSTTGQAVPSGRRRRSAFPVPRRPGTATAGGAPQSGLRPLPQRPPAAQAPRRIVTSWDWGWQAQRHAPVAAVVRDGLPVDCCDWHGDGTAGGDERSSGLVATAPLGRWAEDRPRDHQPRWQAPAGRGSSPTPRRSSGAVGPMRWCTAPRSPPSRGSDGGQGQRSPARGQARRRQGSGRSSDGEAPDRR